MAGTARSEALQVFLRVRPPIMKEVREQYAVHVRGTQAVTLIDDRKETTCSYDYVFNEISEQAFVFEKVKPLLEDVLSGVNACIFAYGQTSAGKSYTMIGPNGGQDIFRRDADEWGILPRASEFLLGYLNEKANEGVLSYEVKASFLQIYNENLYDLLRDTGPMIEDRLVLNDKDKDTELKIREIPRRKTRDHPSGTSEVFVAGLSEFRVQTSEDILRILAVGANNRMTRSTDFNATSSRSHALLQLTFEIEAQTETGQTVINKSKLNLVDLAGSEKIPFVASEYNNAKHMKELTSINKSLSSLGNVISALSSNSRTHIPYRDSKLTRILQDSLSGNTRTILIACVAPTIMHASETLSTLQFADRAKNVMLSVKPNTLVDDKLLLSKAHEEITRLKTLLAHALKQLEQKARDGGPDPADLLRLQEENEALRRDNAALKKAVKNSSQPPSHSISPLSFEQQIQQQQQQYQQQFHAQQQQQQQPNSLPYLNYSATNPSLTSSHQVNGMGGPQLGQNGASAAYQMGGMSVDSLMGKKANQGWEGAGRFSYDQDREKKGKKQSKARNVPPLFDLLDSGRQLGNGGKNKPAKKMDVPAAAKIHSKVYKSANEKQIEELNSMLSANNLQQQQNMMQYLQQQQFLQQNFPHQQLNLPYINAATSNNPVMAAVNTMAASIMQPNSYNTNAYNANPAGGMQNVHMPALAPNQVNQPYRPAPVHLGAPYQAHYNPVAGQTEPGLSYGSIPTLPVINNAAPSAASSHLTDHQQQNHHGHHRYGDQQEERSPTTQEPAPSPHRHQQQSNHRARDEPQEHLHRSRSDDSVDNSVSNGPVPRNNHGASDANLSGRSMQDSSRGVADSGRVGSGHSELASPAGHNGGARMPANRIVRKGQGGKLAASSDADVSDDESEQGRQSAQQQQRRRQQEAGENTPSMKNKPSSSQSSGGGAPRSAGGGGNGSQPAFLASIMSKQAQLGTPSGLVHQSGVIEPPIQRAANLSHSSDDIGRALQLFSFRMNTWDRIQIVDYDSVKKQHKCRHSDGAEQWLDLAKKPIRAIPEM